MEERIQAQAGAARSRRRFLRELAGLGLCALAGGGLLRYLGQRRAETMITAPGQPQPGPHTREAMYYTSVDQAQECSACHTSAEPSRVLYCHTPHESCYVKCDLCPRGCVIAEGHRGECGVRENRGGVLHTTVFGNPCAVADDPIEKKPLFHFLPGSTALSIATAGCNLHCRYCQNWSISQSPPEKTENTDLPPQEVVEAARRAKAPTIAYTYSEPTVFYEYMLTTARLARDRGLRNVVISNGYINPEPLKALCRSVDAIKIDLKGVNERFYEQVCSGTLQPVMDSIQLIHEMGVHLEIVNLVVPTLNDDERELRELVRWVRDSVSPQIPLHFSRFHPMYKLNNLPSTPVDTLTWAWEMAREEGLHYAYVGNVMDHPGNHTYCPHCDYELITRMGYWVVEDRVREGKCAHCGAPVYGVWE
jgi:pyruvate formate lyase activating enzyme